jgi:hypothetical protein
LFGLYSSDAIAVALFRFGALTLKVFHPLVQLGSNCFNARVLVRLERAQTRCYFSTGAGLQRNVFVFFPLFRSAYV